MTQVWIKYRRLYSLRSTLHLRDQIWIQPSQELRSSDVEYPHDNRNHYTHLTDWLTAAEGCRSIVSKVTTGYSGCYSFHTCSWGVGAGCEGVWVKRYEVSTDYTTVHSERTQMHVTTLSTWENLISANSSSNFEILWNWSTAGSTILPRIISVGTC